MSSEVRVPWSKVNGLSLEIRGQISKVKGHSSEVKEQNSEFSVQRSWFSVPCSNVADQSQGLEIKGQSSVLKAQRV